MRKTVELIAVIIPFVAMDLHANDFLKNLPADTWYEVPQSNLTRVGAPDVGQYSISGPKGVTAFSGGAYDPNHRCFIAWGGGHADYAGNEIYHFEMDSLKWVRFTEPDSFLPSDNNVEPNRFGRPISRHTYDAVAYLRHADRFFNMGGAMATSGYATNTTWTFDPNTKTWQYMQPAGSVPGGQYNMVCEYDDSTRKVYLATISDLFSYDYDSNTWTLLSGGWQNLWGEKQSWLDSKRRRFIVRGKSGYFKAWDIDKKQTVSSFTMSGDSECMATQDPVSFDYDSKADRYVGLFSNGVMFVANPDSMVWHRKPRGSGPLGTGWIFGDRWCYIPEDNVFFCMTNDAQANVWFYKHTAGGGTTKMESARSAATMGSITLKPSPLTNMSNLILTLGIGVEGLKTLALFDVTGHKIRNLGFNQTSGRTFVARLGMPALATGIYVVRIKAGSREYSRTITIIR